MGAWKDLPNELAIMVLHWLDRKDPIEVIERWNSPRVNQDILQCSYVSRQFRNIVEPILYREVKIKGEEKDSFPQIRYLARTIASRPRLGDLVQKLDTCRVRPVRGELQPLDAEDVVDLCNSVLSPEDLQTALENMSDEDRASKNMLLDATTRLGLSNGLVLQESFIGEFILLLHLLPRLQELQLEMQSELASIALASLGAFGGAVSAGLQSISKLSIFHEDDQDAQGGFPASFVVPFMMLPSLTSFTVGALTGGDDEEDQLQIGRPLTESSSDPSDDSHEESESSDPPLREIHRVELRFTKTPSGYLLPPNSSSITRLDLAMSVVSSGLLGRLLTLPVALESFQYEIGDAMVGYDPFVASEVRPGLLAQASSLKEFAIDTRPADSFYETEPLFGSLAELGVLERLALPVSMLLRPGQRGSEVGTAQNPLDRLLPSSLVTLKLDLDLRWSGGLTQFLSVTEVPKTLTSTIRRISTLKKVVIGSASHPQTLQIREKVLAEASRLCPRLTLEFKVRTVYFTPLRL